MKTICPYCFKTIDLNKTDFRCASKLCLESGTTQRHIIPRKLAKVDRKGFATCDVENCQKTTHTMVCNYCKHDLPDTISKSQTRIISIVRVIMSPRFFVSSWRRVCSQKLQKPDRPGLYRIAGKFIRPDIKIKWTIKSLLAEQIMSAISLRTTLRSLFSLHTQRPETRGSIILIPSLTRQANRLMTPLILLPSRRISLIQAR